MVADSGRFLCQQHMDLQILFILHIVNKLLSKRKCRQKRITRHNKSSRSMRKLDGKVTVDTKLMNFRFNL